MHCFSPKRPQEPTHGLWRFALLRSAIRRLCRAICRYCASRLVPSESLFIVLKNMLLSFWSVGCSQTSFWGNRVRLCNRRSQSDAPNAVNSQRGNHREILEVAFPLCNNSPPGPVFQPVFAHVDPGFFRPLHFKWVAVTSQPKLVAKPNVRRGVSEGPRPHNHPRYILRHWVMLCSFTRGLLPNHLATRHHLGATRPSVWLPPSLRKT
jgi:hypothetical protein